MNKSFRLTGTLAAALAVAALAVGCVSTPAPEIGRAHV